MRWGRGLVVMTLRKGRCKPRCAQDYKIMAPAPLTDGHKRIIIPLAPHAAMTKLGFILTASLTQREPTDHVSID